jgi:regulator of replication initiation timing|tara:strand:+ start:325 stop:501 length:177 start_codon:yes stop_codon:yes gene_type:complete
VPKQDPEEQIKELKTNLKFISKQLEKAYDKNSKLRVENIELKNKLSILPNSIVKKKDE